VLPFGLAAAILLATGPYVQFFLSALVEGNASTLYGTAFNEGIADFPNLIDWLATSLNPIFLLIGAAIGIAVASSHDLRHLILRTFLVSWTALALLDTAADLFWRTEPQLLEDILGDTSGAIVLCGVIAMITLAYESINDSISQLHTGYRRITPLLPLIGSLAISLAVYLIFFVVYQPVPVPLEAVLTKTSSGFVGSPADPQAAQRFLNSDDPQSFSGLPKDKIGGRLTFTSVRETLPVHWRRVNGAARFGAIITLVANCVPDFDDGKLPSGRPTISLSGVKDIQATFENMFAQLTIRGDDLRYFSPLSSGRIYYLGTGRKSLELSQFSEGSSLYVDSEGDIRLFLSTPMIGLRRHVGTLSSRVLKLGVDGRNYRFDFPARLGRPGDKANCRVIPANSNTEPIVTAGVVIALHREDHPFAFGQPASRVGLGPSTAHFEISDISPDRLKSNELGRLHRITFSASSILVDGKSLPLTDRTRFLADGSFDARFNDEPAIELNGTATGLWQDNVRLNPTRWERIPIEFRIPLLGALFTLLIAAFRATRWLRARWLSNEPLAI
jgi:hypothetical protein